ncbi:interleukin-21 receptor-like isoform X1 [Scleropages formosus]|uniref:Interleukin-21 receptor-like n=2 Tax=Scleropages formosus TaxID=113540 RepID=A0A8C9S3L2_SCLFO|nr:interleukin-21 receptor-like isoform X1 [Scleropages formosus]XP_029107970.1 interleukin-21 receptor-like isoform X1 [Scleropages formosus]
MKLLLSIIWIIKFQIGLIQVRAQNNGLLCVNDYSHTINCEMNIKTEASSMKNTSLEFFSIGISTSFQCLLRNVKEKYRCIIYGDKLAFSEYSEFRVTLYTMWNGKPNQTVIYTNYIPKDHIKPTTPRNLTVFLNSGHYHFMWDCGYDKDNYIFQSLKYMLLLYKNGDPNNSKTYHPMNNTYYIEDGNLDPNTEYVGKVRSSPMSPYKGYWSDWSNTVQWRTKERKGLQKPRPFLIFGGITYLVCVVASVLLLLLFRLTGSLKIKAFSKIPTPAPYFQPLYTMYKGNFKNWLLYPSYMGETFKMDELLKIDTLIEAKPHEENFQPCTHHLTKCHVPYISHLGKNWAVEDKNNFIESPVLPSGKASVTETLNSESLEMGGPSEDDSGCEHLSPSLASSGTHEVASEEPWSQGYQDNYCTLADTQIGLFPAITLTNSSRKPLVFHCPLSSQVDLSAKNDH